MPTNSYFQVELRLDGRRDAVDFQTMQLVIPDLRACTLTGLDELEASQAASLFFFLVLRTKQIVLIAPKDHNGLTNRLAEAYMRPGDLDVEALLMSRERGKRDGVRLRYCSLVAFEPRKDHFWIGIEAELSDWAYIPGPVSYQDSGGDGGETGGP